MLGFTIHWEKSSLHPSQTILYGKSTWPHVTWEQDWYWKLCASVVHLTRREWYRLCLLCIYLVKCQSAMWWSLLIRRILRWFRSFLLLAQEVNGNDSLHLTLSYQETPSILSAGVSPGESGIMHFSLHRHFCLQMQRNVSFTNHGGKWPEAPSLHINCLELFLVLKVLKHSALLLTD